MIPASGNSLSTRDTDPPWGTSKDARREKNGARLREGVARVTKRASTTLGALDRRAPHRLEARASIRDSSSRDEAQSTGAGTNIERPGILVKQQVLRRCFLSNKLETSKPYRSSSPNGSRGSSH